MSEQWVIRKPAQAAPPGSASFLHGYSCPVLLAGAGRARLNLLRARARDAEAGRRVKLNEKIRELESRRGDASEQLDRLKDASGDAWPGLRDGAEEALQALSSAVSEATARYR